MSKFQSTRPIRGATVQRRRSARDAQFQSTRPIRGATGDAFRDRVARKRFQSTRPIRGATIQVSNALHVSPISIHAPHTGRDRTDSGRTYRCADFNPRAPYGARRNCLRTWNCLCPFQSTRPIRGATMASTAHIPSSTFQSTRPIRGATMCHVADSRDIWQFQSTRPIRGATYKRAEKDQHI